MELTSSQTDSPVSTVPKSYRKLTWPVMKKPSKRPKRRQKERSFLSYYGYFLYNYTTTDDGVATMLTFFSASQTLEFLISNLFWKRHKHFWSGRKRFLLLTFLYQGDLRDLGGLKMVHPFVSWAIELILKHWVTESIIGILSHWIDTKSIESLSPSIGILSHWIDTKSIEPLSLSNGIFSHWVDTKNIVSVVTCKVSIS